MNLLSRGIPRLGQGRGSWGQALECSPWHSFSHQRMKRIALRLDTMKVEGSKSRRAPLPFSTFASFHTRARVSRIQKLGAPAADAPGAASSASRSPPAKDSTCGHEGDGSAARSSEFFAGPWEDPGRVSKKSGGSTPAQARTQRDEARSLAVGLDTCAWNWKKNGEADHGEAGRFPQRLLATMIHGPSGGDQRARIGHTRARRPLHSGTNWSLAQFRSGAAGASSSKRHCEEPWGAQHHEATQSGREGYGFLGYNIREPSGMRGASRSQAEIPRVRAPSE